MDFRHARDSRAGSRHLCSTRARRDATMRRPRTGRGHPRPRTGRGGHPRRLRASCRRSASRSRRGGCTSTTHPGLPLSRASRSAARWVPSRVRGRSDTFGLTLAARSATWCDPAASDATGSGHYAPRLIPPHLHARTAPTPVLNWRAAI